MLKALLFPRVRIWFPHPPVTLAPVVLNLTPYSGLWEHPHMWHTYIHVDKYLNKRNRLETAIVARFISILEFYLNECIYCNPLNFDPVSVSGTYLCCPQSNRTLCTQQCYLYNDIFHNITSCFFLVYLFRNNRKCCLCYMEPKIKSRTHQIFMKYFKI